MVIIPLQDIIANAWTAIGTNARAAFRTPERAVTTLAVVGPAMYAQTMVIDAISPASLLLHGAALAGGYCLAGGIGKVFETVEAARERREEERFRQDLLRYVELPMHGYMKRDRIIATVGAVALAGLVAGAAWTVGKWFLSGKPIPAEKEERSSSRSFSSLEEDREEDGASALPSSEPDREHLSSTRVLPEDHCIMHGRTRYSLGCFDLQEGLGYPADERSAAFNRLHSDGKAQDIACLANGVHGVEGSPVYAPISGRVARVDRINRRDPLCTRDDSSEQCHDKGGLSVVIESDDLRVYLAHGMAIPDDITSGMEVTAGQTVMYCGATGNATHVSGGRISSIPHIHMAVQRREGDAWMSVNPFDGDRGAHGQTEPARRPTKRYESPATGGGSTSLVSYLTSRGRP